MARETKLKRSGRAKPGPARKLPLSEVFREKIRSGEWKEGEKLPKEKELARSLGVCAATVQRHLMALQAEGLIEAKRGIGRFVAGMQRREKTGMVGVVIQDVIHLQHPEMRKVIRGVSDVLSKQGLHMTIFAVNELNAAYHPVFEPGGREFENLARLLDGAIFVSAGALPDVFERFARRMPVVTSHFLGLPEASSISLDLSAASHSAIRQLLDVGHTRIAVITRNLVDITARLVRDGARLALNGPSGNTPPPAQLIFQTVADNRTEEGERVALALWSQSPRPTAIIATDWTMLGVLRALKSLRVKIPRDVSLISLSPVHEGDRELPVSSMDFDQYLAGRLRAEKILSMIQGDAGHCEEVYIPPVYNDRGSVAPPPNSKKKS